MTAPKKKTTITKKTSHAPKWIKRKDLQPIQYECQVEGCARRHDTQAGGPLPKRHG